VPAAILDRRTLDRRTLDRPVTERRLRGIFVAACVAAGLLLSASPAAIADDYPAKPVHILIGFPPGTTADVLARVMAPALADALGQAVVVDNRPGAGSSLAAEAVARAPADGYTLLLSTIANTINPSLYKLSFDFAHDLTGVTLLADAPAALVTWPGGPASLQDLIAAARAKPGQLSYASSGNGTVTHLYGELLDQAAGIQLVHVPYKGSSQAVTDLLAGRVALLFSPASTIVPQVKAGKMKALAAVGRHRIPALPDVPTMEEAGIRGFDSGLWFGLNAPGGTPPAAIERLNREVARVLQKPELRAQLEAQSIEPATGTPQAFDAFIAQDIEKWARVVKSANIQLE
jgi:tripartite-type tricarboxylate transporter receptor subunit TctC